MSLKIKQPTPLYFKGDQRVVLLLHGFTGSPNDVRMLARALEKQGFTVYAPMFTGHGTTRPENLVKATPEDWWQDTKNAIKWLQQLGFTKIAIFGLSLGGIYSIKALTEYPDVIIGGGTFSSPLFGLENSHVYPNFMLYCKKMLEDLKISEREKAIRLEKLGLSVQLQLQLLAQYTVEVRQKAENITQPVLLLQGKNDQMIDSLDVYRLRRALSQTHAKVKVYSKSEHVITVGKEHHQVEADVLDFLDTLPWS